MEKRTAKGPSCAVPASCAENPSRLQNNHIMNSELSPNLVSIIDALHQQQVIAYPTEAVFGLGCDPDSEQAVNALLALKQRPWEGADSDRRRLMRSLSLISTTVRSANSSARRCSPVGLGR